LNMAANPQYFEWLPFPAIKNLESECIFQNLHWVKYQWVFD
jgi:hypothetical protein